MALIEITCANPICRKVCMRNWQRSKPPPRYCSNPCVGVHNNAQRRAAGLAVWHRYEFTERMDTMIRRAFRGKFGSLKRAWEQEPSFARAGISYDLVKRRAKQLGLVRTTPDDPWMPEETAYCAQLVDAGHAYETIVKKLASHGYHRTKSALIHHMWERHAADRYGAFLSTHQLAIALDCDDKTVTRWTARGLLVADHTDGRGTWYSEAGLRAWIIAHPYEVARCAPDLVWLIGVLCPSGAGDTRDRPGDGAEDDGAWMNGEGILDRAAAD